MQIKNLGTVHNACEPVFRIRTTFWILIWIRIQYKSRLFSIFFCLSMEGPGSGPVSVKIIQAWEARIRNTAANLRNQLEGGWPQYTPLTGNFLAAEIFGRGFGSALI
jgi:hypothetical protein